MRTWVKVTIAGASLIALGLAALAGTGTYFVLRHLDTRSATEASALREFEQIRTRFGGRLPLIEVVDAGTRDFRIHRVAHPEGRSASTFHVLTWSAADGELFGTEAPLWLLRFNMVNVLSRLGVAPERFRLTVQDIERYGPGIVIDYSRPGQDRALLWVD